MIFDSKPLFVDVALDFDGVIHSYGSGWCGLTAIPDEPVPGAIEWILAAVEDGKQVAIHSCRSRSARGRRAMRRWLEKHAGHHWGGYLHDDYGGVTAGLCLVHFPRDKPAATVCIDDRAVRFEGTFPDLDGLLEKKPWNKQ